MKIKSIILLALYALLASNIALAEPKKFAQADTNADGILDSAELKNSGIESKTFEEIDANKDGKIDKKEYEDALAECD